ncbi:hypothetical protein BWI17_00935 [Betaproteobacteria bacterium GR16-43]|nr:hypothetical protein BWI17_00935 [Betaproteobacteria bacterium GR16-43]
MGWGAILAVFAVLMVVVLWMLFLRGEAVGHVDGACNLDDEAAGRARVVVKRDVDPNLGEAIVFVQMRVTLATQGVNFAGHDARALADLLDQAAARP